MSTQTDNRRPSHKTLPVVTPSVLIALNLTIRAMGIRLILPIKENRIRLRLVSI